MSRRGEGSRHPGHAPPLGGISDLAPGRRLEPEQSLAGKTPIAGPATAEPV